MPRLRRSKSLPNLSSDGATARAGGRPATGPAGRAHALPGANPSPATSAAAILVHSRVAPGDSSLPPGSARRLLLQRAMLEASLIQHRRPPPRSRSDPPPAAHRPRPLDILFPARAGRRAPGAGAEQGRSPSPDGDHKSAIPLLRLPPAGGGDDAAPDLASPRFPGEDIELSPEDDLVNTSVDDLARRLGFEMWRDDPDGGDQEDDDDAKDDDVKDARPQTLLLNGHGTYSRQDGRFVIPGNVTIEFLSEHGVSVWGGVGPNTPPVETLRPGDVCPNYRCWPLYGPDQFYFRSDEAFVLGGDPLSSLPVRSEELRRQAEENILSASRSAYQRLLERYQSGRSRFAPAEPALSDADRARLDVGTSAVIGVHGWGLELHYVAAMLSQLDAGPITIRWLACREVLDAPAPDASSSASASSPSPESEQEHEEVKREAPPMASVDPRGISDALRGSLMGQALPTFRDGVSNPPWWQTDPDSVAEVEAYRLWRQQQYGASALGLPADERRAMLRRYLDGRARDGAEWARSMLEQLGGMSDEAANALLDDLRLTPEDEP